MVDVRGDVLRPPHGTTPAAVKANKNHKMSSFKSNENIHKKEDGSYYAFWSPLLGKRELVYMHLVYIWIFCKRYFRSSFLFL